MPARCDSVSSFSHIRKMTAFQILKQNRRTDKYDRRRWFLSLSLLHLLLLHEESASSVTELRYRMFTEKNSFSGDRSPSTLDTLVFAEHWYFFWTILLGVRNPPPPRKKAPVTLWWVRGRVKVRLGIGLSLESGGLFSRGIFSRTFYFIYQK